MKNKTSNLNNTTNGDLDVIRRRVSWLGLINKLLFQWFFIRLTRCQEKLIENYTLHSFDLMIDGNISSKGVGKIKTYQWYSFQYWILPLTGWKSDFIYLNKKAKFIKISKKYCI
jgi:hypothetical protein